MRSGIVFHTYADLREAGVSRRQIDGLVGAGRLLRVRKGRYVDAGLPPAFRSAAEWGVRLDCVSLLRELNIFVHDAGPLHVQADRTASRLPRRSHAVVCHWRDSVSRPTDLAADLTEALAQAVICQPPTAAVATLDSAWHGRWVDDAGIAAVFARLPASHQSLRGLLDPRSESGTESLVRLMLRRLGRDIDAQVQIEQVGRVDLLVDGWLIVECDSEAFHSGWAAHRNDRRRDAEAARRGYVTLRLIAEDILYRPEWVVSVLKDVLARGTRGAR